MCSSNKLNSSPFFPDPDSPLPQFLCPMWWKQDHQTVNEAWICHFLLSVILYEYRAQWAAHCPLVLKLHWKGLFTRDMKLEK